MNKRRYGKYLLAVAVAAGLCSLLILTVQWKRKMEARSGRIGCVNYLNQICLAFRQWSLDSGDKLPFNVSTNLGGTLELCARGPDGFDRNAVFHFQVLSNELNTPKCLVCPKDSSRQAAVDFSVLRPENISYRLYSGTNVSLEFPQAILAVCSIDGNAVRVDGSIFKLPHNR